MQHVGIGAGFGGVVIQLRAAVHENRREGVLQAEFCFQLGGGLWAIAEAQGFSVGAHFDARDLRDIGFGQPVQCLQHRIDGRMRVTACGPWFEAGAVDQPIVFFGNHQIRHGIRRSGGKQTLFAFQYPARPTHARQRQLRRQPATACGFGVVQRFGRHRFVAHLPQAAGTAAGVAQCIGQRIGR
ncbi:hypothetical protein D3C71_1388570 [compost metagenome]